MQTCWSFFYVQLLPQLWCTHVHSAHVCPWKHKDTQTCIWVQIIVKNIRFSLKWFKKCFVMVLYFIIKRVKKKIMLGWNKCNHKIIYMERNGNERTCHSVKSNYITLLVPKIPLGNKNLKSHWNICSILTKNLLLLIHLGINNPAKCVINRNISMKWVMSEYTHIRDI